jgi:hypothetical protein
MVITNSSPSASLHYIINVSHVSIDSMISSLVSLYKPILDCASLSNDLINNPPLQSLSPHSHSHSMVINLSSLVINLPSLQILEKGFNFSLASQQIPLEYIVSSIESITHHLSLHEVEEIKKYCGRILCFVRPPKPNLTKDEFQSIRHLNNNLDIIILKYDKGNTTTIMNTTNYEYKLQDLLSSSSYKPLSKKPLNTITNLVTKAIKSSSLDPRIQK